MMRGRCAVRACRIWAGVCLAGALLVQAGCGMWSVSPEESERFWELQAGGFEAEVSEEVCHVHGVETVRMAVPWVGGMCLEKAARYVRARLKRFPNSFWVVQSCFCDMGTMAIVRWVCPVCREEERRWRERHGWSVEQEEGFR